MPPKAQRVSWRSWCPVLLFITLLPCTTFYICPISLGHINFGCAQYCILHQMHHHVKYFVSLKIFVRIKVKFLKNKIREFPGSLCKQWLCYFLQMSSLFCSTRHWGCQASSSCEITRLRIEYTEQTKIVYRVVKWVLMVWVCKLVKIIHKDTNCPLFWDNNIGEKGRIL